jgi:hypothetical protein
MRYLKKKIVLPYLYNQLTGNFLGFMIGMSATGLVSQFFETRSIRNLWGLSSKKTIIDKETFAGLEWIISIVIGFIVFEIITKVMKERLVRNFPRLKRSFFRILIRHQLHNAMSQKYEMVRMKSAEYVSSVNVGIRQALNKFGKRTS